MSQNPAPLAKSTAPIATLATFLNARKDAITKVAASGMDVDRIIRIALANVSKTPALLKCSPDSVYLAIHQSVQLGLEPGGPLGHAYLVPFKGACVLVIGFKGLVALARRSGEIATVEARIVHAKDRFEVDFGTDAKIVHRPDLSAAPGAVVAAYCVITYRSGEKQFDVMSLSQIAAIEARSPSNKSGPWVTDWEEMAKKTVVRRGLKMAPLTIEAAEQLGREDDQNAPSNEAAFAAAADVTPAHDPETGEVRELPEAQPRQTYEPASSRAEAAKAELRERAPAREDAA